MKLKLIYSMLTAWWLAVKQPLPTCWARPTLELRSTSDIMEQMLPYIEQRMAEGGLSLPVIF